MEKSHLEEGHILTLKFCKIAEERSSPSPWRRTWTTCWGRGQRRRPANGILPKGEVAENREGEEKLGQVGDQVVVQQDHLVWCEDDKNQVTMIISSLNPLDN